MSDTKKIAELNDLCRTTMGFGCRLIQTSGICGLSIQDQSQIREKVERFNSFSEENDPYEEHDFGAFFHQGYKIFWKIDYYAPNMLQGSENPADPTKTSRVLTIMLAEEW